MMSIKLWHLLTIIDNKVITMADLAEMIDYIINLNVVLWRL